MTIVTANTRLARTLRREHDLERKASGERVWESPDILPWGAWLARLWSESTYEGRQTKLLLSAPQEQVLWEQAVSSSPEAVNLMNPGGAAPLAAEAWKLIYEWKLPRHAEAFAGVPDAEAFHGWMQSFESALASRNFITLAELPSALSGNTGDEPVSYAGFDEPTPAQRRMFGSIGATLLHRDPPAATASQSKACLGGAKEELAAAASWARSQLEKNADSAVGVVIPDLTKRRAAVDRTFAEVLGGREAFHTSAPNPLAESPVASAALLVLQLCRGFSLAECGLLLRSPYFGFSPQEGARVDLEFRQAGISRPSLAYSALARLFPKLAPAKAAIPKALRPSDWSKTFSTLVALSGWPGRRELLTGDYQAIESWKDLLAGFARMDAVLGEIGFDDAVKQLTRLAADTPFGPAGEDEPVQVMGVLEAAGTRFDALWIAGLEDRVWPPAPHPNPFLPVEIQRAAGTPNCSAESQFAYAKRVTDRLLIAAPEIVCSYPARDGEEILRPSPLIGHLAPIALGPPPLNHHVLELEPIADDPVPPLVHAGVQRGGMNVIADQSACPFRAFARHRLHTRSLDEVEPGLTPRERGTVAHKALELIWAELKTHRRLMDLTDLELLALVGNCVADALAAQLGPESRKLNGLKALEQQRLSGLVSDWMDLEKRRPAFEVLSQETARRFTLSGLELEIRADRVDRYLHDGSLAIIDFKTGSVVTISGWDGQRPKEPQVPLYCVAAAAPVSSAMFGHIAAGRGGLIGYSEVHEPASKPSKPGSMEERVRIWDGVLRVIGEEFVRGEARVDPANGSDTCRNCGLQPLCRIETLLELSEDQAGE
jgi:ATP-dependent helicase/nuclease subunit B